MEQIELDLDDVQNINEEIWKLRKKIGIDRIHLEQLERKLQLVCKHPIEYQKVEGILGSKNHKRYCDICKKIIESNVYYSV